MLGDKMEKIERVILCIAAFLLGSALIVADLHDRAYAGRDDMSWQATGTAINVRSITISSSAGTALWDESSKRPDSVCRPINQGDVIWIGTVSATMNGVQHTNQIQGFPVYSTETIRLGAMTGAAYATAGVGQSNVNVRCLDGITQ